MKKALLIVAALVVVALAGTGLAAVTATTGTVTACATSPAQTISANGVRVGTITPKVSCVTSTYTIPPGATTTVFSTVTAPASTSSTTSTTTPTTSTTTPTTTTSPTTTTNPAPGPTVAPGQSWDSAYNAAACGATIEVLAGDHGNPSVDSSRCAGNPVVFHGDPGVTFGKLTVNGSNVSFDHMHGQSVDILCAASNVDIGYSDFGNTMNRQPQVQSNGCTQQPANIVVHDSTFHDFAISDPSVHSECFQILEGANIQLLRDDFHNCGGTAALGLTCNGDTAGPILVENSFVYGSAPNGIGPSYGAQISGDCRNLTLRNNSSTLDWFFADGVTGKGYRLVNNYMAYNRDLCGGRGQTVVASHNVWQGGTCGPTDTNVAALQFVSPTDLHLAPGSNADGMADPAEMPPLDFDGQSRPQGLGPDAGADEH